MNIDHADKFDLPPGMTMKKQPGELYNVAAFHQIHCLTSIRRYLWHFKFAVDRNQTEQLGPILLDSEEDHILECFDYIRQSLMCAGDMTLEYPEPESGSGDEQQIVNGWGVTHQCTDWVGIVGGL